MAYDLNDVWHDDGRTGRVVGDGKHCYYRVIDNETGLEEEWHMQSMTWPALIPENRMPASPPSGSRL
ncbi:hypothetical protein [Rhizobium sp. BK176]|uniref:hypothetical protein n=1 Tax=Rhizobium sp. BK176 TaxID=2587071 RepID=UPI0021690239|nr:hypothetical protein [Rhizobium sp. BK176]MCS4089420.1 hypothetical protein [Rhizobium sp. BK176]